MAALDSEVKSQKAALDAFAGAVDEAKTNDQAESLRGMPYWEKKRELENRRQDFHKLLADKILNGKTYALKFPNLPWSKLPIRRRRRILR